MAGQEKDARPQFAPCPLTEVVAEIKRTEPAVVFAPHVETSLGILLPDTYISAVADAVHSYGGVFVIDAIAAGNVWCDMKKTGVDVLISAPQKGWTGPSCAGLVLLSERAAKIVKNAEGGAEWEPKSQSFCCNLRQWLDVVEKYEGGGFKYYTTLPTDALMTFRNVIKETEAFGIAKTKAEMLRLGQSVRDALKKRGFKSVAADGFAAPGVVVVYDNEDRESRGTSMIARFKSAGIQIAGGVPFKLGEDNFDTPLNSRACTFRIGLFGLDKMMNVDECVRRFETALDKAMKKDA